MQRLRLLFTNADGRALMKDGELSAEAFLLQAMEVQPEACAIVCSECDKTMGDRKPMQIHGWEFFSSLPWCWWVGHVLVLQTKLRHLFF